jgi:hypothetical protein
LLQGATRALCIGMGGGGDIVGALGVAEMARARGVDAVLGGVTWERRVIDPRPGPRRLDEIEGIERLSEAAALTGGDALGPGGLRFAEVRMAELLGERTVLVDPTPGPAAVAEGIATAARHTGCDLVLLVDVGGDVLAHGDEPGLASPLCDSIMLAAAPALDLPVACAVFGPCCDGELSQEELLARIAEVAAAGGLLGAWGLTPEAIERLDEAVAAVPTEASAQALACARGAVGVAEIRGGRRHVPLSPLGAVTFFFAPDAAIASAARGARAVLGATDLEDADARLEALGMPSELRLERAAAK